MARSSDRGSTDRYPITMRRLHAVTAGLVALQALFALVNATVHETRPETAELALQAHISLGAGILAITMVRLIRRIIGPVPPFPPEMRQILRRLGAGVHLALYVTLFVLPISGYVKLAALGFEVSLFGLASLPPLPFDARLAAMARIVHDLSALAMGLLLVLHIGAALAHGRLFGFPILHRMSPLGRRKQ